MSIEQALASLTAAVEANTAMLQLLINSQRAPSFAAATEQPAQTEAAPEVVTEQPEQPEHSAQAEAVPEVVTEQPAQTEDVPEVAQAAALTHPINISTPEAVAASRKLLLDVMTKVAAKNGRDAVIKIISDTASAAGYSATKLTLIRESDIATAYDVAISQVGA